MRILVTGGTGVMGSGTVTELLCRGHSVVLVARHAAAAARQWAEGVTAHQGDVSDARSIRGVADGCDVVLHMVGVVQEQEGAGFDEVNVGGTANMIAEAERAGVPRFVFVSSLGAPTGTSDYHRSKRAAEALVRGYRGGWVVCRPGNVYGPGDEQISLLLRMVRSPSPVVPRLGNGDQPIQPIWWEDCAAALATVVERPELDGRALDFAGEDRTSQNDLLDRLCRITGQEVRSVPLPDFLATLGARAISLVGWDVSFNAQQLTMLHEGNTIAAEGENALTGVLGLAATPLDVGLRELATLQPEQLPSKGVGDLKRKRHWADIERTAGSADELFALFRQHFNDVMPVFVGVDPEPSTGRSPEAAANGLSDEGETITLALPMRGHVQVRVAELGASDVTLLTLEGHPLAGAVRFSCTPQGDAVRFGVEVYDRAATVLDLIAMRTIGDRLQAHTWSRVVEKMVELSGGFAASGVQHETESLDDEQAAAVERWLEEVTMRRKRAANADKIDGGG